MNFYAGVDSVTIGLVCKTEDGRLTDCDSVIVEIRKCRSTSQKDWDSGDEALAPAAMENVGVGRYRYSWNTANMKAGPYAAQVKVTRGGVVNVERLAFVLK